MCFFFVDDTGLGGVVLRGSIMRIRRMGARREVGDVWRRGDAVGWTGEVHAVLDLEDCSEDRRR